MTNATSTYPMRVFTSARSATQSWFGVGAPNLRSTRSAPAVLLVIGVGGDHEGPAPRTSDWHKTRMRRSTVQRAILMCSRLSWTHTLPAPLTVPRRWQAVLEPDLARPSGNGFLSAIGVIQALYHRRLTGEPQAVDTSILNAGLPVASMASRTPDGTPPRARPSTGCSSVSMPCTASMRPPTVRRSVCEDDGSWQRPRPSSETHTTEEP